MFNYISKNRNEPDWSFQTTAISSLVKDFRVEPMGRFLLVLPTGGGKTLTAIRTLSALLEQGILNKEDKVLWAVHTLALKSHAQRNIQNEDHYNGKKFRLNKDLKKVVEVKMKAEAIRELSNNNKYKLVVIDEAHHAAAETYQEFFDYPVGILGLTATPRRMDYKNLPFKKISYSITFRELVRRKVVLLPKFLPDVQTFIPVSASSLDDEVQLEKFNSQERNTLVSRLIFTEAKKHHFKKAVVFAGTNAHVKRLYDVIKAENESLGNPFAHVGYIFGGDNNDKGIKNEEYLEWHHKQVSSILINCKILNEGYDDPNIDTVIMATPTNSILYYLQCIGRVVRTPEDHRNAKAYVLEIVDKLPNVAYRIDNKWLFAEISDYLEPLIIDIKAWTPVRVVKIVSKLLFYRTRLSDIRVSEWTDIILGKRVSLLLFNDVPYSKRGVWRVMTIPEGDVLKINVFNDLSENISENYKINHEHLFKTKYKDYTNSIPSDGRVYISTLMSSLHRAEVHKSKKEKVDSIIYLSVN